jgi:hypothetical protein
VKISCDSKFLTLVDENLSIKRYKRVESKLVLHSEMQVDCQYKGNRSIEITQNGLYFGDKFFNMLLRQEERNVIAFEQARDKGILPPHEYMICGPKLSLDGNRTAFIYREHGHDLKIV